MTAKAVLVTGAGARVGRAIAEALGRDGWAVAVHYNRSRGQAEEVVATIESAGARAAAVPGDLADADAVDSLVARAADALGQPLTALVNNASTFEDDRVDTMTRESWDHHAEANLRAPCFLVQAFAAQLPEGAAGAVVNIVDQRVKKPTPQFFTYALSKAGLAWATVTMAQALAPRVRVNAVLPGPTLRNPRQDEESWERQLAATPLETGSPPGEIVAAVRYLLDAKAVTGALLPVDGGQRLAWKTADVWGISE